MLTETYRKTDEVPASKEGEDVQEHHEVRQAKLKEAGFSKRALVESKNGAKAGRLETARVVFDEITGPRLRTWRKFLPSTCDRADFDFDAVPEKALDEIIQANSMQCFDRIEIWTPEGNSFLALVSRRLDVAKDKLGKLMAKLDPMAVGVIEDVEGRKHYFPIARWGESLLPYKSIKRHVRRVHGSAWALFGLVPVLAVVAVLAAYYNGIVNFGYVPMFWIPMAVVAFLGVCCFIAWAMNEFL